MANRQDPVAVIGLGRFGSAVALGLANRGTEVLAIDKRPALVQRLSGQISHVVTADSTDVDALREIGVGDFTRVIVAIGTDQQASILTTSLLTDLEVEHIWAKALDRQHAKILTRIGAHHVVLPEQEMGERMAHLISGEMLDYLEVDADWALVKAQPPRWLVGIPLGESRLRAKHGVTVVSVKHEGQPAFTYADNATTLGYGDQILLAGRVRDVERFVASL